VSACVYHPIYRSCRNCGKDMEREQVRECIAPNVPTLFNGEGSARIDALMQARALIQLRLANTPAGFGEAALHDLLVEFDQRFPEGKP